MARAVELQPICRFELTCILYWPPWTHHVAMFKGSEPDSVRWLVATCFGRQWRQHRQTYGRRWRLCLEADA